MTRKPKEECQRCGRGVPPRMRDTGFCSHKCSAEQKAADEASAESEREAQEIPVFCNSCYADSFGSGGASLRGGQVCPFCCEGAVMQMQPDGNGAWRME